MIVYGCPGTRRIALISKLWFTCTGRQELERYVKLMIVHGVIRNWKDSIMIGLLDLWLNTGIQELERLHWYRTSYCLWVSWNCKVYINSKLVIVHGYPRTERLHWYRILDYASISDLPYILLVMDILEHKSDFTTVSASVVIVYFDGAQCKWYWNLPRWNY